MEKAAQGKTDILPPVKTTGQPALNPKTPDTVPENIGGTAYYQQVKPRSNEEIHGKAIRRTPDEAKAILVNAFEKLDEGWDTLDEYKFVMLTEGAYQTYREINNGIGDFWASYGNVRNTTKIVRFDQHIQSATATGMLIPVFVHESVFDSDEAIIQILYHEMHEIEELRYLLAAGAGLAAYREMVRPDRGDNLHYNATNAADKILLRYRELLEKEGR